MRNHLTAQPAPCLLHRTVQNGVLLHRLELVAARVVVVLILK